MTLRGKLRAAGFAALPLVLAGVAAAQKPAGPVLKNPSTTKDVLLVSIPVVVLDKKGGLVQNLTKDRLVLGRQETGDDQ